ncbi:DUF262 domain-containing protein [Myroides sp. BIT-d1]|uniref:DUF262 domain-containing protein n=1 Tax=Myroides albus TaxID=2562892 RepID=A0A6I3LNV8_9FLAO|nr:DUF262 domain-containing protein [Myroides albus]MTG99116.1 DUF262 domain-containing protein [Myroides albus]
MSTNIIKLKSVSELFGENFFIPAYQRGYRWDRSQINDLLSDIYNFAIKKNKSDKEFYCLQPIIVKYDNENKYYEVIDGQQRLTSLKILLTYFTRNFITGRSFEQRYGKPIFEIEYQTRPGLNRIFDDNIDIIAYDNIDVYHITQAYKYIEDWFNQKINKEQIMEDELFDSINRTLVYNSSKQKEEGVVQVIWYELKDEDINPIDTFIRINLGKIPLNSAELVKALFLQNYLFGDDELAKVKQREIAHQWDTMERQLQNEEFWSFISNREFDARIEYLLEVLYLASIEEKPHLKTLLEKEKNPIFRYYNIQVEQVGEFSVVTELWKDIYNLYSTLLDWYNNPVWYHYIGYLIFSGRSLFDIYKCSKSDDIKEKDDFTNKLIQLISIDFKTVKYWDFEDDFKGYEQKYLDNNLTLPLKLMYGDTKIFNFLLLFNIESIVQQCVKNKLLYKFPFSTFRNMRNEHGEGTTWDIEHINSDTDNPLLKIEDQLTWTKNALSDVQSIENTDLYEESKRFIETKGKSMLFQELKEKIEQVSGDNLIPDLFKNDIGNLTLLDATTNRGYGNALFVSKRKKIIEKEKSGLFVPLATRNVFLKYYDLDKVNKSYWSVDNIIDYRIEMQKMLEPFLPIN